MSSFRAFNLTVRSILSLPGAQATAPVDFPELQVDFGPVSPFAPTLGPYALHNEALLFQAPAAARYRITPTHITIESIGPEAEMIALLLATALPAALWMRHHLVLHAAAAILPGQTTATAIAGPSGSGKSRVLRRLDDTVACTVADDTLALAPGLLCSGLPGGIWMRQPGQTLEERSFHPISPARQSSQARLGRIVALAPDQPPGLHRVHGAAVLTALLGNLHRPLIPRILGLERANLPRLAELAAAVPVYSYSGTPENLVEVLADADDLAQGDLRG